MRKIRIAQIGTSLNGHGNMIWAVLRKNPQIFEIAGYAFAEGEREKFPDRAKWYADYRELTVEQILEDPTIEAVTVETEEIYLTKYALLAAKAGKHIHMEKPGGLDPAAFRELIETVKKNGKIFHTGYMYRYNPVIQDALEQIRQGALGQIISVEAQMSCPLDGQERQWLEVFPGGMMFYLGCHLVDLVLQIQGLPRRVIPLNKATGVDGIMARDFGMAVLEYDRGWSMIKTNGCEKGGYLRRQLVISGTKATLELKPLEYMQEKEHCTQLTVYDTEQWHTPGRTSQSDRFHRYEPMLFAFAQMVRGEKENPWTPDYELTLFELLQKCCGGIEDESNFGK